MIYVDFVVHCDFRDCTRVEHVPVEEPIHGAATPHVRVQIPATWRQAIDGVYCENHGPAEAAT